MSFQTKYLVALVQFREPGRNRSPEGVRYLGLETEAAETARREENSRKAPMTTLLERNGASFAHVASRLMQEGLVLDHAFAQQRYTLETEHKSSRPYTLTTFVFSKGGQAANGPLAEVFDAFARRRYEYVKANEGTGESERPMLCLMAKTTANRAAELKYLADADADVYGIAVSKAVRKEDRQGATKPAEVRKSVQLPLKQSEAPVSDDPQLDRLIADGWEVITEMPDKVVLHKTKNGKLQSLEHPRPKKKSGTRGIQPQRKRA